MWRTSLTVRKTMPRRFTRSSALIASGPFTPPATVPSISARAVSPYDNCSDSHEQRAGTGVMSVVAQIRPATETPPRLPLLPCPLRIKAHSWARRNLRPDFHHDATHNHEPDAQKDMDETGSQAPAELF